MKVNFDHLNPSFYYCWFFIASKKRRDRMSSFIMIEKKIEIPFRDGTRRNFSCEEFIINFMCVGTWNDSKMSKLDLPPFFLFLAGDFHIRHKNVDMIMRFKSL